MSKENGKNKYLRKVAAALQVTQQRVVLSLWSQTHSVRCECSNQDEALQGLLLRFPRAGSN